MAIPFLNEFTGHDADGKSNRPVAGIKSLVIDRRRPIAALQRPIPDRRRPSGDLRRRFSTCNSLLPVHNTLPPTCDAVFQTAPTFRRLANGLTPGCDACPTTCDGLPTGCDGHFPTCDGLPTACDAFLPGCDGLPATCDGLKSICAATYFSQKHQLGLKLPLKKAAEGRRSPRRWRDLLRLPITRSVLDCASPLALWGAWPAQNSGSTRGRGGNSVGDVKTDRSQK
jgi:hypothetical protein